MKRTLICIIVLLLFVSRNIIAQPAKTIKPINVTVPPVIDGVLDEDIWKNNPGITGFKSFIPDFGKELPFNTIVWLAYDEENLYFAFKCFDNEPDKIKVSVDARDKIRADDWVCVNLDSFNDQQTLYCIYANANGIQMDTRFAAGKEDLGMDLVWYSAGKIDQDGYTIEIKLPLKSIRFSNKEPVMMAAFFERYVSRTSTHVSVPELDPQKGYNFFGQMQTMQYEGVKHYKLFEILPSATYSYKGAQESGKMTTLENKPDAGITFKYGITSQLILDATINPDFSQVEADAGQVDANLRYQLYYPEKRPFFQEGNENFQIAGLPANNQIVGLVHTRNIANPLIGTKLSGKIGLKNTLSVMYAADRIPSPEDTLYGNYSHFPVMRYKRSLKDDSYLGVIGTAVLKDNSSNIVYGADGLLRLNKSTVLEFNGLFSNTNDTATGINKKPGQALGLYLHSEQRNIDYAITAGTLSEFFISQTGFIARTGTSSFSGSVTPRIYTESKLFRRFDFSLYSAQLRDNIYDKWETYNSFSFISLLGGTVRTNLKFNYSTEIYLNERFNTSGMQFTINGQIGTKVSAVAMYRNRQTPIYGILKQGYGRYYLTDITYFPFEKLHTGVTLVFQDLYNKPDDSKVFDYLIARGKLTWQVNKYLFFRGILEYNDYRKSLKTDFLASFTYIPGTVFHVGYGSFYERKEWDGSDYIAGSRMMEMKRGFFAKISYLFRL